MSGVLGSGFEIFEPLPFAARMNENEYILCRMSVEKQIKQESDLTHYHCNYPEGMAFSLDEANETEAIESRSHASEEHSKTKSLDLETGAGKLYLDVNLKEPKRLRVQKKPYQCEICKKEFSKMSNLKRHELVHTGEKPYQCKICKKKFQTNFNLKEHVSVHTGEKRFQCEICTREFHQNSQLKAHLRVHTGEKPHECEMCDKKYKKSYHLKKHLRVHTGERPYECETCRGRFNTSSDLNRHKRIHTREKPMLLKNLH